MIPASPRPLFGPVRQQALQQRRQRRRHAADVAAHVGGRVAAVPRERLPQRAGRVRQPARQHLEQRHPQAEQVAAEIVARRRVAQLRRQVIRRAEHVAGAQERRVLAGAVREAQVDQHRRTVGHQPQVVGLDVAVQEPGGVQRRQRFRRLPRHPQRVGHAEAVVAPQPPSQRLAGQQVHHEEVRLAGDVGVRDADQVRVADVQAGAGLALEQLDGGRRVVPVVAQHLDGARRLGATVAGSVDLRHRPAAQAPQQFVPRNARDRLHDRITSDRMNRFHQQLSSRSSVPGESF
jgi:hypothetical protein